MRLVDAVAALGPERLATLARRHGVAVDPAKRLAPAVQVARALASPRALRDHARWPEDVRAVARALLGAPSGLARTAIGGGVLRLLEADLVFEVPGARELVAMPSAYRVQLPSVPGDSPRAARMLVAALDDDALRAMVGSVLPRATSGPRPLVLGDVLESLESPEAVERAIGELGPRERALLGAIEARGGVLETHEVLELAGEPMRMSRSGRASVLGKRNAAHSLVSRALLLPDGPARWAVPAEVAAVVDREARARAARSRAELVGRIEQVDAVPARARFGEDPGPAALALFCALGADAVTLSPTAGAPRSSLRRAARRVGVEARAAEMLVSLGRADGLVASSATVGDVGRRLLRTWRGGGAWDEARADEDAFRSGPRGPRLPTPTRMLRDVALDLLGTLAPGRFARVEDLLALALTDARTAAARHALERVARRAPDAVLADPGEVLRRIVAESMAALGLVDVGTAADGDLVRLAARARRWLAGEPETVAPSGDSPVARWDGPGRLRVGAGAPVPAVLALAQAADAWVAEGELMLEITAATLERAAHQGASPASVAELLTGLAGDLDAETERALAQALHARVRCERVEASAVLGVGDERLRAALLADPAAAEVFDAISVPGVLVVRPGVSPARVARLVRRLGGEIGRK